MGKQRFVVIHSHWTQGPVCCCCLVTQSVTSWTVTCQVPLSLWFSRQEYRSGLLFPSPGGLPDPRIEPTSATCFPFNPHTFEDDTIIVSVSQMKKLKSQESEESWPHNSWAKAWKKPFARPLRLQAWGPMLCPGVKTAPLTHCWGSESLMPLVTGGRGGYKSWLHQGPSFSS